MYTILGSDQKEYGPVSPDELRRWISEGRANAGTLVRLANTADWRPLAEFPEFADAFPAPPPVVSRPLAEQTSPQPAPAPPAKPNGLAIASIVLGGFGVFTCGLSALVGLILGILALKKAGKEQGAPGRGLALAGIIVSAAFLVLMPIAAGVAMTSFGRAKERASDVMCMSNTKQIALGLMMYSSDNDDILPMADKWSDAIGQYVGNNERVFQCPKGSPNQRSHYGFNRNLGGLATSKVKSPAKTVMVFETDGGWNVSGGAELLLKKPRHELIIICFADGHCEAVKPSSLPNLRWEP